MATLQYVFGAALGSGFLRETLQHVFTWAVEVSIKVEFPILSPADTKGHHP
jgi:hypothetical protein